MPKVRKEGGMVKMKRESGEPVYHRAVGRRFAWHSADPGSISRVPYGDPNDFFESRARSKPSTQSGVGSPPLSPIKKEKQN